MTHGVRGATTVRNNNPEEILMNTKELIQDMVKENAISADAVSHVFISATEDINACFPAKSLRQLPGWTYVPVMCMQEINVPDSLQKCIRVMMIVNTEKSQKEIKHIFHQDAVSLRPDLLKKAGE